MNYEKLKTQPKVLVVCDDKDTHGAWTYILQQRHISALQAESVEEAVNIWNSWPPDLAVIDVVSALLDAVGLTKACREFSIMPILILASCTDEADILRAYQAGADDFVHKPISPALFLAKVNAWLKRSWTVPVEALDLLQLSSFVLDPKYRQVTIANKQPVKLSNLEFRLLYVLMSNPNRPIEVETLVERVWGYTCAGDTTLLKNVIYRLRRKIEPNPESPQYIQTDPDIGYKFYTEFTE